MTPQQYVARLVADAASSRSLPTTAVDRLVAQVEAASVPGRGTVSSASLRLATGVLAEELLRRDPGPGSAPRRPPRPPRRGVLVLGAPATAAATRAANDLPVLRPRHVTAVVVLARPLDEALADVWASRVGAGMNRTWGGMTATLAARDRIPPQVDVARIAARWARRVGHERVHLVTRPGPVAGLTRRPFHVVHPEVAAAPVELARGVGQLLGILTDPETHARVIDRVLRPTLAGERGPGPAVRPRLQPWLERRAWEMVQGVREGGYALHGDPADLAPSGAGTVRWPGSARQEPATLAVAVRTLLALCEESP